jgi:hypothetical protein
VQIERKCNKREKKMANPNGIYVYVVSEKSRREI